MSPAPVESEADRRVRELRATRTLLSDVLNRLGDNRLGAPCRRVPDPSCVQAYAGGAWGAGPAVRMEDLATDERLCDACSAYAHVAAATYTYDRLLRGALAAAKGGR